MGFEIHPYGLRHIVVVEDQVLRVQAVYQAAFGIGDGSGRNYQRDGASELRPRRAGGEEQSGEGSYAEK